MRIKLLFVFLVYGQWLVPVEGIAQENKEYYHYKDRIILKTNQVLFAQLIDYSSDSIILEMKSGSRVKFLNTQVKDVLQYSPKESLQTNSWHSLSAGTGLIFGKDEESIENIYGGELSFVYKYFKGNGNVFMGGIGLESYNLDLPLLYLPVMVGYEYHLPLSSLTSIYLGLRSGYTFISYSGNPTASTFEAGWLISPTIGFLFKINSRLGIFAETGLKYQQANHSFDGRWRRILDEEQFNRRYLLRMGMIF